MDELTKKQKGFVKDYLDTGNGVQSALKNYDTDNYNSANQIAMENLQKPTIQKAIENEAGGAVSRIVELSKSAEVESVKLNANKDILDRAGYKPVERQDITSKGEKITMSPEHLEIAKEYEDKLKGQL